MKLWLRRQEAAVRGIVIEGEAFHLPSRMASSAGRPNPRVQRLGLGTLSSSPSHLDLRRMTRPERAMVFWFHHSNIEVRLRYVRHDFRPENSQLLLIAISHRANTTLLVARLVTVIRSTLTARSRPAPHHQRMRSRRRLDRHYLPATHQTRTVLGGRIYHLGMHRYAYLVHRCVREWRSLIGDHYCQAIFIASQPDCLRSRPPTEHATHSHR